MMEMSLDTKIVEHTNYAEVWTNICVNGSLEEFLIFAKQYNIFQISRSRLYDDICNKIKARLDREGLPYETVRPT
jgi:hypothetical protein